MATNLNPQLSPSVWDSNPATVALTGDNSILVRYHSYASFTIGAQAQEGATIVSQKAVCQGSYITGEAGTFENVESGIVKFSATDSRGNSASQTVNKAAQGKFVPYIKLTCDLLKTQPDTDGNMTVQVSGNYFNGSFGKKANSLLVQYRYKYRNKSWLDTEEEWRTMAVAPGTDSYTAQASLTGLNYRSAYTFQARAVDALATVFSEATAVKAMPVFDWGENDFNVNGTLTVNSLSVDYPVAQGQSGGWFYRKWASGFAECWFVNKQLVISGGVDVQLSLATPFGFVPDSAAVHITAYSQEKCIYPQYVNVEYDGDGDGLYDQVFARLSTGAYEENLACCANVFVIGKWK